MTTTTTNQIAAQVASRYENLTFAKVPAPDTSKNRQRGVRKSPKRKFIR